VSEKQGKGVTPTKPQIDEPASTSVKTTQVNFSSQWIKS